MKFRKKPVVVEATQFDGTEEAAKRLGLDDFDPMFGHWYLGTMEGRMAVNRGDWIITGVVGERYPCHPRVFEASYEKVEEPPAVDPDVCPYCFHKKNSGACQGLHP